jgi:hypothetical protein
MSSRHPITDESHTHTREVKLSSDQRLKLNYKFAKHVIVTFQNSKVAYVQPFLKPVDPRADDASDYHTIIEHPMDLSTMLQELESGKYTKVSDVEESFDQMFSNCYRYNASSKTVYQRAYNFERAFRREWDKKNDWIEAQAARSNDSSEDVADDSSEGILHDTSDDEQMEDANETDEGTQESDESSDDDLRPRYYGYGRVASPDEDYMTNDDTSVDDTTEEDQKLSANIAEDETSEDDLPPVTRRRHPRKKPDLTDDHTPKKTEHRCRARKKDGSKHHTAIADAATVLKTNHKRPLDTTTEPQIHAQDHLDWVEQSTEVHSSPSIQKRAVSVEQATKKSCSNIFQGHFGDSFQESQTEQPQPELAQHQSAQPTPSSASNPDPNPLKTMLASIISTQIDTTTSKINNSVSGQYTQHLKLLEQLCSSNEKYEAFCGEWKTKAMDKVSQMQVQEILVRGVEQEVGLALVDTVTEQARKFCELVTSRATAFSNTFGGEEGR